ncbi:hypothetical protein E2C01_076368 [Portunus trituberculatus]|uniref:Uncharacterized protein n=1 Tax=Portunus trituberculatus TaxID=210409 RepID=A0A5B7IJL3_PORTR|nr:hypothetical protein [Portunus trituberculatus]
MIREASPHRAAEVRTATQTLEVALAHNGGADLSHTLHTTHTSSWGQPEYLVECMSGAEAERQKMTVAQRLVARAAARVGRAA